MIIKRKKAPTPEPKEEVKEVPIKKEKEVVEKEIPQLTPETLFSPENFAGFSEREERRRGDRRRGYRRVDDRNLISRAQEEANSIKENAAKEGFQYGIGNAGREIEELRNIIAGLTETKENAYNLVINDIAELSIRVAEKIIQTEVRSNPDIVLSIISEVLKDIGKDESKIIIKVNPNDYSNVNENIPSIFPYAGNGVKIIVLNEEEVETGSCIIETSNGIVDANFTTQLNILKKAFEAI